MPTHYHRYLLSPLDTLYAQSLPATFLNFRTLLACWKATSSFCTSNSTLSWGNNGFDWQARIICSLSSPGTRSKGLLSSSESGAGETGRPQCWVDGISGKNRYVYCQADHTTQMNGQLVENKHIMRLSTTYYIGVFSYSFHCNKLTANKILTTPAHVITLHSWD